MSNIGVPLTIPELDLKPEPTGAIKLSEDMQQVLALLAGFWLNKRILLKATPTGALFTTSPQIKDVFHVSASSNNYVYQGSNVPCSEVMIMGHHDNLNRVYVKPHATATINNAWPLEAREVIVLGITNLNMLNLLIAVTGERAVVAYTE